MKPGSRLNKIVPSWMRKVMFGDCAEFGELTGAMDRRGVEWCTEHRSMIVDTLARRTNHPWIIQHLQAPNDRDRRKVAEQWFEHAIGNETLDPETPSVDLDGFVSLDTPRSDTLIVTTHWNPAGFDRLRDTYYEWLPSLGPLASSVRCLELVFDNDEPEIDGSSVVPGTREANAIWQKEPLINHAVASSDAEYIIWVDHDVVFANPHWYSQSIDLLASGVPILQPFGSITHLDLGRRPLSTIDAITKRITGAPGFAWAARRDYFESIGGLCYLNAAGSSDQTLAFAVTKCPPDGYLGSCGPALASAERRWMDQCVKALNGRSPGNVDGRAYHLWHGAIRDRQYHSRDQMLASHGFDPSVDVRLTDSGILEWSSDKPGLHKEMRKYFRRRREDGR